MLEWGTSGANGDVRLHVLHDAGDPRFPFRLRIGPPDWLCTSSSGSPQARSLGVRSHSGQRPRAHREERRVRAHLFLCLLAGYLEWHLRRAWAPLLFDDETLADARRTRNPVAPAKPTQHARHKKASRRTDDGLPLHSLDTLVAELATRCRNTCRVPADPSAPALSVLTEPTPTQRRAVHLIETFPVPGAPES